MGRLLYVRGGHPPTLMYAPRRPTAASIDLGPIGAPVHPQLKTSRPEGGGGRGEDGCSVRHCTTLFSKSAEDTSYSNKTFKAMVLHNEHIKAFAILPSISCCLGTRVWKKKYLPL